ADPARRGLLYCGTETGIYISFDDGAVWQPFQSNLPVVPIHDLLIKDNDLIAATHGRSFWVLDDLTPLHQISDQLAESPAALLKPRDVYRLRPALGAGWFRSEGIKNYTLALGFAATYIDQAGPNGKKIRTYLDAGKNPPDGLVVHYYLQEVPEGDVALTFRDANGAEIKRVTPKPDDPAAVDEEEKGPWMPVVAGMNRFVWDMCYPDATKVTDDPMTERSQTGPLASPGSYQVELLVGDQTFTQSFAILKDPRVDATAEDFAAQFELMIKIRDKLSETHAAINRLRSVRAQVQEWVSRTEGQADYGAVKEAAQPLIDKLSAIEEELIQTKATTPFDMIALTTKLNAKLAALTSVVASADAAPTQQAYDVFADLSGRIDCQLEALRAVMTSDLTAFNDLVRRMEVPAVIPPTLE
ncbi:MAG: hypothetical protein MI924_33820, partial [Chloroflexales bacterium]|nr:hypothetical protein [Chloroflexales bacterium]